MSEEYLVFESAIEGLFVRGLAGRLDGATRERLRAAGLDLDRKLLPAYPFAAWMRFLDIVAASLFPGLPSPEAYHTLGELLVAGYHETLTGRVLFPLLKVIGPRRSLFRTTRNFRTGSNYVETRLVEVGPNAFELWMNEAGRPEFTQGILLAGLRAAGAQAPRVEIRGFDGHACTFSITWGLEFRGGSANDAILESKDNIK